MFLAQLVHCRYWALFHRPTRHCLYWIMFDGQTPYGLYWALFRWLAPLLSLRGLLVNLHNVVTLRIPHKCMLLAWHGVLWRIAWLRNATGGKTLSNGQ